MDDDTPDLIAQLCTRVGIIMEGASLVALTVTAMRKGERSEALSQLERDAEQISNLMRGVRALAP